MEREKKITIDVVIPTYRPGKEFPVLLRRLARQERRPDHVLIINTEKKYWNKEWEEIFPGLLVRHITKAGFDHGRTRREAADLLKGEILIYMTQDAVPADRFLIRELSGTLLNEPQAGACYARQLPRKNCDYLERQSRAFNYPEKSCRRSIEDIPEYGIKTFFCSNVCAAYWREAYEYAGGFPAKAIFNEDMVMACSLMKTGYTVVYNAKARVYHSHNYTAGRLFRRNFDNGVSHAEFPEVFALVPPEGEGLRMITKTAGNALKQGKAWILPELFVQSAMKYAGFSLGKHYEKLPRALIHRITTNKAYWKNVVLP